MPKAHLSVRILGLMPLGALPVRQREKRQILAARADRPRHPNPAALVQVRLEIDSCAICPGEHFYFPVPGSTPKWPQVLFFSWIEAIVLHDLAHLAPSLAALHKEQEPLS